MYGVSTILKAISVVFNRYMSLTVTDPMEIDTPQDKPSIYVFDRFVRDHCSLCHNKWTPIQAVHAAFHDYCKALSPRPTKRPSYADIINHLTRHDLETKGTHNFYVVKGLEITKWP